MLFLLQQVLGVGLPAILKQLSKAHEERLSAETQLEKIESEEKIKTLELRKEIILKAQEGRVERWIRVLFALPFVLYVWKILLWDKVLSLGVTDPLSGTFEYILWTVLGGYFLEATIRKLK